MEVHEWGYFKKSSMDLGPSRRSRKKRYDYEKYGTERMNAEDGMFTDRGYIAYKGYYSMEEVMNGSQSSRMEMGGFSR